MYYFFLFIIFFLGLFYLFRFMSKYYFTISSEKVLRLVLHKMNQLYFLYSALSKIPSSVQHNFFFLHLTTFFPLRMLITLCRTKIIFLQVVSLLLMEFKMFSILLCNNFFPCRYKFHYTFLRPSFCLYF